MLSDTKRREYKSGKTRSAPSGDRVPPQALDVERTILGSMMIDEMAVDVALESISSDDFYSEAHTKIFICMRELSEANQPVDIITVSEKLRVKGWMDDVGAEAYISALNGYAATAGNLDYYTSIIKEKATLRRLISIASEITTDCFSVDREVQEVLDVAESKIFAIAEARITNKFESIGQLLPHTVEEIDRYALGNMSGIPTGFTKLDELTTGLQKGDLIIVGGRPSMGKTAFCLSMAMNIAVKDGNPTAVFSLEMSKSQLAQRILCSTANIDMHMLRSGHLPKRDYPKIGEAARHLSQAPLFIDDTPGINPLQLRAMARRIKAQRGLKLIIVDYLQLMAPSVKTDSMQQDVSQISRSLKGIARELDVPVIALSQLSRKVEDRPIKDRRPQLSDLRESGAIEQDADLVMFVYREEKYNPEATEGIAEIIIGKQRNGPIGKVELAFVKSNASFRNLPDVPRTQGGTGDVYGPDGPEGGDHGLSALEGPVGGDLPWSGA